MNVGANEESIPVTILSGTLGAGKTTTLNYLLTGDHGYEIAVLVNDVGEVNVDAQHVERHIEGEVIELSNGCICCGLQGQLTQSVIRLVQEQEFEYLLVEPSGISEPAPVAKQFVQGPASHLYELNSVTTVVDARQFYDAFGDGPAERREDDEHGRPISDLIVEGVEFCDTLILNKTDLVSDAEKQTVIETLRTLQPEATLLVTEFGQVDPAELLDSGRFGRDIEQSARWKQTLEAYENEEHEHGGDDHGHEHGHDGDEHDHEHEHDGHDHDHGDDHGHEHDDDDHGHDQGHEHDDDEHGHDQGHEHEHDHDHVHPPEEYGIESFVYQESRPMHPERLAAFFESVPEGLIRAKGWIHVKERDTYALELSLAGREAHITVAGRWIASLPEQRQSHYRALHDPHWDDQWGDCETRLVIIGRGIDRDAIQRALDACVIEDDELKEEGGLTDSTEEGGLTDPNDESGMTDANEETGRTDSTDESGLGDAENPFPAGPGDELRLRTE